MDGANAQPATYFTSLTLENVRCFGGRVTLSLRDREGRPAPWTLILGDNGVGKTTILECLAWMQPDVQSIPQSGNARPLTLDAPAEEEQNSVGQESTQGNKGSLDVDSDQNEGARNILGPILVTGSDEVLESLIRIGPSTQTIVQATLAQGVSSPGGGEKYSEITLGLKLRGTNETLQSASYIDESTTLENIEDYRELVLIAYTATRRMGSLNVAEREDVSDFTNPFSDDGPELYDAKEILLRLDYASSKNENKGPDYDRLVQVKRLLADILPGIGDGNDIVIKGPQVPGRAKSEFGAHLRTRDGVVSLSALSLGYRTTLAWAIDLAWKMFNYYPDSVNPLAEPAIVLVDEIDLHLHPRWQQTIKGHLVKHFPRVQFICTTHSPLMAQASASDNLVVVRENGDGHLVIENDPVFIRGWRVDQILTSQYFGLNNTRGLDIQGLIEERARLLTTLDRSEAEERRLVEIEGDLLSLRSAESEEDERAMDLIRRAAELLKGKG